MDKSIEYNVTTYRINNPDCEYCEHRDKRILIGKVPECLALRCLCGDSKKKAKKCPIYVAEVYE